jgi:PAS domain S-box-containing protein
MSVEKHKTILLVDDEAIIAMSEKMALEKYGYKVITTLSGEEAVAMVEKSPAIDLILMDINLGAGMDGTEAAAIILNERDIPIVFLSSHMEPEIVAKTEKITSYGYVVKDSSITVLDASIKMAFKLFASIKNEREKESQREAAFAALQVSLEKYRVLFESFPLGITISDKSGKIIEGNKQSEQLLGISRDVLTQRRIDSKEWRIIRKDGTPMPADEYASARALKENRLIKNVEMGIVKDKGEVTWINVTATPIPLEDYGVAITYSDITERMRTEEALRNSENKFSKAFRASPDVLVISRLADGLIIEANDSWDHLFGYSREEVIGRKSIELELFANPEDRQNAVAQLKEQNFVRDFEVEIKRKSGEVRQVTLSAETIEIDSEPYILTIIHDITERKQAEEVLRISEKRYRTLFDTIDEGFCIIEMIYDADGKAVDYRFIEINPAFEKHTGLQQALGKTIRQMVPNHDAHWFEIYVEVARTGEAIRFEQPANAMQRYYSVYAFPIDGDGRRKVGILFNDITARKRWEEALRESEERFRTLYENSTVGLYRTTPDGRILLANPTLIEMLGYLSFDELAPRDLEKNGFEPSYPRRQFIEMIEKHGEVKGLESAWTRKDGTIIHVRESARATRDAQGKTLYYDGTVEDISTRKRVEETLRESETRYRELFENISSGVAVYEAVGNGEDFIFKDFNRAGERLNGAHKEDVIGKSITQVRPGIEKFGLLEVLRRVYATGIPEYYPNKFYQDDRMQGWYDNFVYRIPSGEIVAVFDNINERKRTESQREAALEALRESEDRYRDLVENSQDLICTHDLEGRILSINETAVRLTGYPLKELLGMNMADLLVPGVRHLFKAYLAEIQAKGWSRGTMRIQTASGELRYWEYYNTLRTRDVTVPVVRALGHDITERERAEKIQHIQYVIANAMIKAETLASLLETVRNELSSLLDTTNFLLALYDEASGMLSAPFERDEKDAIPQWPAEKSLAGLVIKQKRSLLLSGEEIRQLDEAGTSEQIDSNAKAWLGVPLQINEKVLGVIVVQSYDKAVAYDQNGVSLLEIIANQLSAYIERKQAEEEIKRQLSEKEILLKEVHHRIKNNIAAVESLLFLHSQSTANPEALSVLQDAIGRVDSMRILYDKLLLSEDYKDISVKNYLDDLIDTIVTLFPDKAKIKIEKRIADFNLDPRRLFPLGIIINELLTNKMKYAFIDKKAGAIKIFLTHADDHVSLSIQDNGRGLPDGFDIDKEKGFGLMLVKMLCQQLGGSFSMEKHKGTRCTVEFSI